MKAPFAPYSDGEANDLSYIHPGLRHLAVPIGSVLLDPANVNTHPAEQQGSDVAALGFEEDLALLLGLGLEAVVDRPGVGRIAWGSEGA